MMPKSITCICAAVLLVVFALTEPIAALQHAAVDTVPAHSRRHLPGAEAPGRDVESVVSVLESRIGDHRLPPRVKERLASMDSRDFGLIAKLCDRISAGGNSAGTDLALLLATALIILS